MNMKPNFNAFKLFNFHDFSVLKAAYYHSIFLVILIVLSILISGCSNSSATGILESGSSSPTSATNQSTPNNPSPQKPGILSRKTFNIAGASMEPTLKKGENKSGYPVYRDLQRGDIVVFTSPDSKQYTMISRIIGLPGETIEIKDRQVLINETVLNELYISEPPAYVVSPTLLPEKSYFILGDNRNNSYGSQNFGPVPLANIQYIIEE